jgi:hypothetical protein
VALYRAKNGDPGGGQRLLDTLTIYLMTLYPLAYWHAHLPRKFWWFLAEDFAQAPAQLADLLAQPPLQSHTLKAGRRPQPAAPPRAAPRPAWPAD